jgi:hypothetical protein
MQIKNVVSIGLRTLTVCLLFVVCLAVGAFLSGLTRAPQASSSQASSQTSVQAAPASASLQTPPAQPDVFFPLLILSLCVGIVESYLILRSSWHGWTLAGAIFVSAYGISTVTNQLDSIFFLSSKLPPGTLRAIFVQGAISSALFAPLAVLVMGKWRAVIRPAVSNAPTRRSAASAARRVAFLVAAFVFLYMFFGYYVAWQNPELRNYYGGPEWPTFFASLKGNWLNSRWIFPLASFRALLYIAFVYPLIRMLRGPRWESAVSTALFLAAWTTMLLFPNSLMPASVARSHFWETLGFSLVFGVLLGSLLSTPQPSIAKSAEIAA